MRPKPLIEALQNLSKAMTEVDAALEEFRGGHGALASPIFSAPQFKNIMAPCIIFFVAGKLFIYSQP